MIGSLVTDKKESCGIPTLLLIHFRMSSLLSETILSAYHILLSLMKNSSKNLSKNTFPIHWMYYQTRSLTLRIVFIVIDSNFRAGLRSN